ncbi:hypothetical protein EMIT0215P_120116 [Pseudomonas serboccidentalis]
MSFFESFVSINLNSLEMDKKIIAAASWSNETKAFFFAKPFDRTGLSVCHARDSHLIDWLNA